MDIVDEALDRQQVADDFDGEADADAFGDPRLTLLGYGSLGTEPLQQGWADDYPGVETAHVRDAEALPDGVPDADYVVLVGGADDHDLATALAERCPDGTTSIAVPIDSTASVGTANATVPCPRRHARELTTDLLTVLSGRPRVSPPARFYDQLPTAGRLHGYRGKRADSDASPAAFAAALVGDALANPFHPGGGEDTEHFCSVLHTDEAVTLEAFDAIRAEISERCGSAGVEAFAVDTTKETGAPYRLTVLRR